MKLAIFAVVLAGCGTALGSGQQDVATYGAALELCRTHASTLDAGGGQKFTSYQACADSVDVAWGRKDGGTNGDR